MAMSERNGEGERDWRSLSSVGEDEGDDGEDKNEDDDYERSGDERYDGDDEDSGEDADSEDVQDDDDGDEDAYGGFLDPGEHFNPTNSVIYTTEDMLLSLRGGPAVVVSAGMRIARAYAQRRASGGEGEGEADEVGGFERMNREWWGGFV
ncbi:hypothetical protein B0J12DRAFT_678415 [Macrophomina phaseolina]|uniref:Uncharacterized protein n=1 Tax=Macrophomina phaseolina TaxID=35725 RepID=A0ABQ8FYQ7_9PEZI|nr:hypothetical protein B0J12DRAFT_678415 [Macrophomina phaseolina]